MITAQELRIGNWVYFIDGAGNWVYSKIYSVDAKMVAISEPFKNEDESTGQGFMLLNGVFPIPLTPEILDKYGFKKQTTKSVTGFTRYCSQRMMLLVDDSENPFSNITAYYERHLSIYECLGERRNLKLHELQNLNYALTGEELEIKL